MHSLSNFIFAFLCTSIFVHLYLFGVLLKFNNYSTENEVTKEKPALKFLNNPVESFVSYSAQSNLNVRRKQQVQPLISAEGKLMSPVFLVLKEQGGKFWPVVEANLFRAVNVYVTASKSGKLTSDHFKIWLEEVYFPNVGKASALLLDAWSGHCPKIVEAIPPHKNIILKKIPTGTTGYIQPLDVYGFRIWKNLENVFQETHKN